MSTKNPESWLAKLLRQKTVEEVADLAPPDPRVEFGARLAVARAHTRKIIAQGLRSVQITDPAKGKDFSDRHQSLNVKRAVLEAAVNGDKANIAKLMRKILKDGAFFEDYSPTFEEERISHSVGSAADGSGWVMMEAEGQPFDDQLRPGKSVVGGDVQIYVPGDDSSLAMQVPLPDEARGDTVETSGRRTLNAILQNPAIAAHESDLAATIQHAGFAQTALSGGQDVIRMLNEHRQHPVEYTIGAIAEVIEVQNASGETIHKFDPVLQNLVSLVMHIADAYGGILIGKQINRSMDVELPAGDQGKMIFNWYITAQKLRS